MNQFLQSHFIKQYEALFGRKPGCVARGDKGGTDMFFGVFSRFTKSIRSTDEVDNFLDLAGEIWGYKQGAPDGNFFVHVGKQWQGFDKKPVVSNDAESCEMCVDGYLNYIKNSDRGPYLYCGPCDCPRGTQVNGSHKWPSSARTALKNKAEMWSEMFGGICGGELSMAIGNECHKQKSDWNEQMRRRKATLASESAEISHFIDENDSTVEDDSEASTGVETLDEFDPDLPDEIPF